MTSTEKMACSWKDFYTARMATAKRDYKCGDCGCEIPIGTQYERATHGWGGFVERLKTCPGCLAARKKAA
jgi:hypothetical protein